MTQGYDRRGGAAQPGAGSSRATPGAGIPGKRTLTEQIPMKRAVSDGAGGADGAASAAIRTSAAAPGHASQSEQAGEPQVDATDRGPPVVQTGGAHSPPMSALAARTLLQSAFGAYRQISAGQVQVLAQADFQTAYDAIYGTGPYAWATYVAPRFGNLNGFAYGGVNYINRDAANITTVPHEMLHTNVASDWRPVVGSPFDEGATEYLEQYALRHGGIHTTLTHSPNQRAVVEAYLAAGATEDALFRAYLQGGASTLVEQWVDQHCQGHWTQVKTATEQSQWAIARAALAPRSAHGAPAGGGGSTPPPAPATSAPATGGSP